MTAAPPGAPGERARLALFAYRARAYQYAPEMATDLDEEFADVLDAVAASPDAREGQLRKALAIYGTHQPPCRWSLTNLDHACDCGLDAALASPPEAGIALQLTPFPVGGVTPTFDAMPMDLTPEERARADAAIRFASTVGTRCPRCGEYALPGRLCPTDGCDMQREAEDA